MAIGGIEVTSIVRSQDYTTVKVNEDNKSIAQQSNLINSMQQNDEKKARQVNQGEQSQWQQKKFDAKEKGSNSYSAGEGRKKKKQAVEKEILKLQHSSGFDIKI